MQHTDQKGNTYPIGLMKDTHLYNTINYIIRIIKKSQIIMQSGGSNTIEAIASGYDDEYIQETAKMKIRNGMEQLPYYIFEASLRGMKITESLQQLLGRTGPMTDFIMIEQNSLPEPEEEYF